MSLMSSMLYTIGTALSRAADSGLTVSVLVEGSWLEGQVAASDGTGVVLESADGAHSVVRTERISAVTVHAASPFAREDEAGRTRIAQGPELSFAGGHSGARPMPGPRPQYA
jgi:hypothetical protein